MRIAHLGVEIVPTPNGAFVGGLVKNVVSIAQFQREQGHDVSIFTTDREGRFREGQDTFYGRIRRVRTRGAYASIPFSAAFLRNASRDVLEAHRREPFDIVHLHSAYSNLGAIAFLMRGLKTPKLFSLYSPNFRILPGHDCTAARTFIASQLARISLNAFDATVVPSRSLVSRVTDLGVEPGRVVQVLPALSPAMLGHLPSKEEARNALGIPHDAKVVLFVGNYSPWKGVEVLLRSMVSVRREFPDAILLAALGEPYRWSGDHREEILALVEKLRFGDAIRQAGIVGDIRVAMRAADVMVSPFSCTCKVLDYPLSMLESMACERPVIATHVGGIPELLSGGRGITVTPGDGNLLTIRIKEMLHDPDAAQEIGLRGAKWVREFATPGRIAETLGSLYLRSLERPLGAYTAAPIGG